MIKNIIFDLGGVIITLDPGQAVRRFEQLGVSDAAQRLDSYTQQGIFGNLEEGLISAETFMAELGKLVGRQVTWDECCHAWQGYAGEVPRRNLEELERLHSEGYRLILLSNTNPFMMDWVCSDRFDGMGHGIEHYIDKMYLSFKMKLMKPNPEIFHQVLLNEGVAPSETLFVDDGARNVAVASQMGIWTLCPENGDDWTGKLEQMLSEFKGK